MKRLVKYTWTRLGRITAGLEKYHEFQQMESLHRIRVELKKLRAVIKVVGASNRDVDAHKVFLPFRKIFKKSGQIRQASVLTELMLRYGIEPVPTASPAALKNAQDQFRTAVPFHLQTVRRLEKQLTRLVRDISRKDVRRYVQKREKLIRKILIPEMQVAKLHLARKHMKQVFYLTGVSPVIVPEDRMAYSRMEKIIGAIHDKELLITHLQKHGSGVEISKIGALKNSFEADREELGKHVDAFYRDRD